jgi:hypothetical protein
MEPATSHLQDRRATNQKLPRLAKATLHFAYRKYCDVTAIIIMGMQIFFIPGRASDFYENLCPNYVRSSDFSSDLSSIFFHRCGILARNKINVSLSGVCVCVCFFFY